MSTKPYICVYDFETDGKIASECEPVQLAACMIHPITLDVVANSEYCMYWQPPDISKPDYVEKHKATIAFHANNYNVSETEIVDRWKGGVSQKVGFELFQKYLSQYNKYQARKSRFGAPIRAGCNIRRFDNIIIDKLCHRYGAIDEKSQEQNIFLPRDIIDILEISYYWFENLPEPSAYNMDALRQFFGISTVGSHDALKDVRDCAWMVRKFMNLFRTIAPKVDFKNAYKRKQD